MLNISNKTFSRLSLNTIMKTFFCLLSPISLFPKCLLLELPFESKIIDLFILQIITKTIERDKEINHFASFQSQRLPALNVQANSRAVYLRLLGDHQSLIRAVGTALPLRPHGRFIINHWMRVGDLILCKLL